MLSHDNYLLDILQHYLSSKTMNRIIEFVNRNSFDFHYTCVHPSALNMDNFGHDSARFRIPFSDIFIHHDILIESRFEQFQLNFFIASSSIVWQDARLIDFNCRQCVLKWSKVLKNKHTHIRIDFWKSSLISYVFVSFAQCVSIMCSKFGQLFARTLEFKLFFLFKRTFISYLPHILVGDISTVFKI